MSNTENRKLILFSEFDRHYTSTFFWITHLVFYRRKEESVKQVESTLYIVIPWGWITVDQMMWNVFSLLLCLWERLSQFPVNCDPVTDASEHSSTGFCWSSLGFTATDDGAFTADWNSDWDANICSALMSFEYHLLYSISPSDHLISITNVIYTVTRAKSIKCGIRGKAV